MQGPHAKIRVTPRAPLSNIENPLDFLSGALTCPTPNHYSIIYYRSRSPLWESKHRSHVTLCDQSSEGGDYFSSFVVPSLSTSPSSSPLRFFSPSSSSSSARISLLLLLLLFIQLCVSPFTRRVEPRGELAHIPTRTSGRDFLARHTDTIHTRRALSSFLFFFFFFRELRARETNCEKVEDLCPGTDSRLTGRHAVIRFRTRLGERLRVNRDKPTLVRLLSFTTYKVYTMRAEYIGY